MSEVSGPGRPEQDRAPGIWSPSNLPFSWPLQPQEPEEPEGTPTAAPEQPGGASRQPPLYVPPGLRQVSPAAGQMSPPPQFPPQPQPPGGPPPFHQMPPQQPRPMADPFRGDPPVPRITPSPQPQPSQFGKGILIGLLVGLLVFGVGGFIIAATTVDQWHSPVAAKPSTSPSPSASAALPLYEQTRQKLNRAKFNDELARFAERWLPYISGCAKNGDKGAPPVNPREDAHITCHYDSMTVHFVSYKSEEDRNNGRSFPLSHRVGAGAAPPLSKANASPSGQGAAASGTAYMEYAYQSGGGSNAGQTVCAIWWEDPQALIVGYIQAYWIDDLSESWDPLRDVWQRYH